MPQIGYEVKVYLSVLECSCDRFANFLFFSGPKSLELKFKLRRIFQPAAYRNRVGGALVISQSKSGVEGRVCVSQMGPAGMRTEKYFCQPHHTSETNQN